MRLSSILTLVAGLIVAGGSAFLAREVLEQRYAKAETSSNGAMVSVVVAANDIAFGQIIEAHQLKMIEWPREHAPTGIFTDFSTLLPKNGELPRRARRPISTGDLVSASKVSDFGEKVTIVQTLSPDHRAMAIKVSAETAVGGFVTPGDYVDVLLTQGRNEDLRTVTILQNLRVIGVDQQANQQADKPEIARTVTVEVSPDEGQRLALAQKAGTLSLTLRTLEAGDDIQLEAINLNDVLRYQPTLLVEDTPVRTRKTIIVRRGTEVSETEVN